MNSSKLRNALTVAALLVGAFTTGSAAPVVPETNSHTIAPEIMQRTYEQVKTPFKYGVVIKGEGGRYVDCPAVFRHDGRWLMMFIAFDGKGYETRLAESDDLLRWKPGGAILTRGRTAWDAEQAAGGPALVDYRWDGTWALE
jgi:hypothetical protein